MSQDQNPVACEELLCNGGKDDRLAAGGWHDQKCACELLPRLQDGRNGLLLIRLLRNETGVLACCRIWLLRFAPLPGRGGAFARSDGVLFLSKCAVSLLLAHGHAGPPEPASNSFGAPAMVIGPLPEKLVQVNVHIRERQINAIRGRFLQIDATVNPGNWGDPA